MFCSRRGSFWRYLDSCWVQIKETTANWMPKGLLPKTVVWLGAETVGAISAEALMPTALTTANALGEACIPFYRQIPLVATSLLLIITAAKTSKKALVTIGITAPLILYFYSLKDLEDKTAEVAAFFISQISQMFASIGGGFFGLAITHSSEVFSTYRENMIVHALSGRVFEGCVKQANFIFFVPRLLTRIFIQTCAYNRKPLWAAFKISVRNKQKKLGIIAPTLSKALIKRFGGINTNALAKSITATITPFFLVNQTPFFSSAIEGVLRKEIERLQANAADLVNILTRSLIEYTSLLSKPNISSLMSQLFYLIKTTTNRKIIETVIKTLKKELIIVIRENSPSSKFPVEKIGSHFLWHEDNLRKLTEAVSSQLNEIGIYLFGKAVYPAYHLSFIEEILKVNIKPFLYFTILRGLGMDLSGDPLEDYEDINLTSTLYHILFFSLAEPLLPQALASTFKKTSTAAVTTMAKGIQVLQGRKKEARFSHPLVIIEDYKGAPAPSQRRDSDDDDNYHMVETPD